MQERKQRRRVEKNDMGKGLECDGDQSRDGQKIGL